MATIRRLRGWVLRLAGTFTGGRRDLDLADELHSHLQLHIDDNLRAGMTAAEARRRAILALGGVEQTKEPYRDQRGMPAVTHLIRDVRYGLRTLRRNPGFAAAAIVTLGLGLGANMAMFRFVDAVLLESLPVPHPEQLVIVRPWNFSYPGFREFAARNADVLASTARSTVDVNLTAGRHDRVPAGRARQRKLLRHAGCEAGDRSSAHCGRRRSGRRPSRLRDQLRSLAAALRRRRHRRRSHDRIERKTLRDCRRHRSGVHRGGLARAA